MDQQNIRTHSTEALVHPERSDAESCDPWLWRLLALLLSYPEQDWLDELSALRAMISGLRGPDQIREGLVAFVDHLERCSCAELQEAYVGWFDRTRSLSLHLFEHSHGEARERGAAMARLRQLYATQGWELSATELPDYLPVVCEFLSLAPVELRTALLSEARPVLEQLHATMLERGCVYAALVAPLLGAPPSVARDGFQTPSDPSATEDFDAVDAAWREEPVTFDVAAALDERATFIPVDRLTRTASVSSSRDALSPGVENR